MKNILVTGLPRVGKTTLLVNIISEMDKKVVGFVTKEVKENNMRIGFEIESFSGHKLMLASKKNRNSIHRIANYGVFVENIDTIVGHLLLELQKNEYDLIVIDEIGKMELFSKKFISFVEESLNKKKVLGSIMLKNNDFSRKIKERSDTIVFEITINNRDKIRKRIMELLM
ncbi:MAG: hypothetical protein KAS63_07045 [Candidatus Heimdallarchaeota archaeon]|nr:hypothetical protein [Candidatus Heimdallarchaeota archaeon]MCK4955102.1 hypothetical protein [Candidatus Heimdallarchaeota archaeon]